MKKITTVDRLISAYYEKYPNGHYFDRETLKLFGERISEMRLLKKRIILKDDCGVQHTCYILSSLQRKAPGGPRRSYTYFDVETLEVL